MVSDIPVIMTASPRDTEIQLRSVRSVSLAGFRNLTISCEPGVSAEIFPDAKIASHRERQGQWRNFICALRIGLKAGSEYFITIEDDVELCRGTADFIARTKWPSDKCGCVQLYSAEPLKEYPRGRRSRLSVIHALDLLGACAIMFRRDAADALVEWATERGWRGDIQLVIDDPAKKKAADTFIGEVLTFLGYSIWAHNPTIVNHIGIESTLGHAVDPTKPTYTNRQPLNFPGIDADLNAIFAEELDHQCVS